MINKKEITKQIDIIDVVSKYIDIEQVGINYKAICPFHNDTNPSLSINQDMQIYKCFVCGVGGNAIDFVSRFKKISYQNALVEVAKITGIKIKSYQNNSKENIILTDIQIYYSRVLKTTQIGYNALKYLTEKRKLSSEIIDKFNLGYSPGNSNGLFEYLMEKGKENNYSIMDVEKIHKFNEKKQDFFQGRIIIPIFNELGKIVGFSGRTLEKESKIKYLNSSYSNVFQKNKIIYNLNNIIGNKQIDNLIIVEGFFDVITANKYQLNNVVASMGTAFTEDHFRILNKYNIKKVYLGFDNDSAGFETINKTAQKFLQNNYQVYVLDYLNYKDIDEYLNAKNETTQLLINAVDYYQYKLNKYVDTDDMDQKISYLNDYLQILKLEKDEIKIELVLDELTKVLNIDKTIILKRLKILKKNGDISIKYKEPEILKENKVVDESKFKLSELEILYFLGSLNYQNYELINNNSLDFKTYQEDWDKLKKIFSQKKEIDETILLDELEYYYQILNKIKKYGKENITKNINLENYLKKYLNKKKINNKIKNVF